MTATESLFFGTINDFRNKICHKQLMQWSKKPSLDRGRRAPLALRGCWRD